MFLIIFYFGLNLFNILTAVFFLIYYTFLHNASKIPASLKRRPVIIQNQKLPEYSLSESIKFVEPLVFSNLTEISKDQFAKIRSYNPSGGAFNLRLSSCRLWGLISDGNPITPTFLASEILKNSNNFLRLEKIYNTSRNFSIFNKLSRDLSMTPTLVDISRLLDENFDNKVLRKIKNIIIDNRLHHSNFSPNEITKVSSKDLRLELSGVQLDVEESRESLLAAIKLLESRLDLFRV